LQSDDGGKSLFAANQERSHDQQAKTRPHCRGRRGVNRSQYLLELQRDWARSKTMLGAPRQRSRQSSVTDDRT
jgi:hypothetical protein